MRSKPLPQAPSSPHAPADHGGPAPLLRLAPDEIRCRRIISEPCKGKTRCSRFTIKLPDGGRDEFCVAHSKAAHAAALRSKAARGQRLAAAAERDRLEDLAAELLPRLWAEPRDFQLGRAVLYGAIVRGDVTVTQAGVLRQIILDAERHAQTTKYDWAGFGE